MSTETKKESTIIPAIAPTVKRNGKEILLVEQVFGKLSDWAGHKFWAPVLDVSDPNDVSWAIAENLNGIVNKQLRLIFAGIYQDAIADNTDNDTGKINHVSFISQLEADWADFTAGVAKLSDLEESIGLLQDQIAPLLADEHFGEQNEDGTYTAAHFEVSDKIMALNKRIVPLRKQLAGIKEVYKKRAANRKSKETTSTTKTAVPATVTQ